MSNSKRQKSISIHRRWNKRLKNKSMKTTNTTKLNVLLTQVRGFVSSQRVRHYADKTVDILKSLEPVFKKPTPWAVASATAGVAKTLLDLYETWPEEFFSNRREWEVFEVNYYLKTFVVNVLQNFPHEMYKTADENVLACIYDMNGFKFGRLYYPTNKGQIEAIYVQHDDKQAAISAMRDEIWKLYNAKHLVLTVNKVKGYDDDESSNINLVVDDTFNSLHSQRAVDYATYLGRYIEANIPRACMLYGPPGTGKSTMARYVIDQLDLKSFRIRIEDLSNIQPSAVFELIEIFQPQAIILDDFDRSYNQEGMLEMFEQFQRKMKVIIATVNDRRKLDGAILRPGRFDEMLYVNQMEEPVVRKLLGDNCQDAYDIVKSWPIAFINEYVIRRRFMTREEAKKAVTELAARMARLMNDSEADDAEGAFMESAAQEAENRERGDEGEPPTPAASNVIVTPVRTSKRKKQKLLILGD